MPQLLPFVPAVPNYRVGTSIAGKQFIFDVRWNGRDESWYFDVLTSKEEPIIAGLKIVLGTLLGGRVAGATFPAGSFVAADTSNASAEASFDDMGTRVLVYFYADGEV